MSVTHPKGFLATGVVAGIKKSGGLDLAVVINAGLHPAAAAVFTTNRFPAAPVRLSRSVMASGTTPTAVVLNAGGANACTGQPGLDDARREAQLAAELLGQDGGVLVCSTGLIGQRLPIEAVCKGITRAIDSADGADGGHLAAEAIRTTDTRAKTAALDADGWSVGGMAKGAGMIAPGLATLLVVVTTDAVTDNATAQRALAKAAELTFNRIDTDGCMSTNDTLILLASGESGVTPTKDELTRAVTAVCQDLAQQCVGDAEGASHEIAITVSNAATEDGALAVARAVARSALFKCAVAGNDPNWGRVVAAVGTTAAQFDPDRVDIAFNGVTVFRQGGLGEPRSAVDLSGRQVAVDIDLHAGHHAATLWTTDLTHAYVSENSDYSS